MLWRGSSRTCRKTALFSRAALLTGQRPHPPNKAYYSSLTEIAQVVYYDQRGNGGTVRLTVYLQLPE